MNKTTTVLSLQDMSAVGRCSLTVTLPIISVMGSQVVPLPTALLSNHLGFSHYHMVDFSPHMCPFMEAWKKNHFSFSAIMSGFLASPEQINLVQEAISLYRTDDSLVVVDPAMADHGKLYSVYTPDMVEAMKQLVREADVITPNFTEAALLLGETPSLSSHSESSLLTWGKRLSFLGPKQIVITSLFEKEEKLFTLSYERQKGKTTLSATPKVNIAFPGTGDIFAAVLTGALLKGKALSEATEQAAQFTYKCAYLTQQSHTDPKYGVLLEPCLPLLLDNTYINKEI